MSSLEDRDLQDLEPYLTRMPARDRKEKPRWSRAELAGRLCELSSVPGTALLTAAFRLVLDAQLEGEPSAWITATPDTFFAPDAAESGVVGFGRCRRIHVLLEPDFTLFCMR